MALVDDFNGSPNGTKLTDHDANWVLTSASATDVGQWTIQNNQLEAVAFRSLFAYRTDSTTDTFKIDFVGAGTDAYKGGPAVRMAAGSEGYALIFSLASGGNFTRIQILKDGAFFDQVTGLSYATNATHSMQITATQNGANVDLEAFINDVSVYTGTDSSSPLAAGNDGIYIGNSNFAITVDNASNGATAFNFDALPGDIRVTESRQLTISGATPGLVLANFDLRFDDASGAQATITAVNETVAGTYQITFNFPKATNQLFEDTTGHPLYLDADGANNTSSAVPYKPQTGWSYIDIGTPNTLTEVYQQYAGSNFVTSDQCVWDNKLSTVTIFNDTSWNIKPPNGVSVDMYRIAANGTKDVDDIIVFGTGANARDIVRPIVTNIVGNIATSI